ncbi:Syg1p [Ascoidea rubescens DSM 1968]|uniref:EXS-domain-containing protein n=1 Tax=Ascoidea rubescens DSM 1968 TaxID=1344418 RepID=A0A1D2V8F9_9ASCO|nr:EXS-domain-containing protein [Ascoidea rubescens DSM 1968]ODV57888.1 EXS-domain-containing protein [Ascoidea rubescens DSM 1968]
MKFAQNLNDNLIPEWRDKYLNYKEGKKILKRIPKPSSALNSNFNSFAYTNTPYLTSKSVPNNTHQRRFSNSSFSFKLPPPAISYNNGNSNSTNVKKPTANNEYQSQNERTPLMEAMSKTKSPEFLSQQPSLHPDDPKFGSYNSYNSYGNTYSTYNTINSNKMDFLKWLDLQLLKVDTFYKEKEKNCLDRYLLLQDQMYQLNDHKIKLIKRNRSRTSLRLADLETKNPNPPNTPISSLNSNSAQDTKHINTTSKTIEKFEMPTLPRRIFLNSSLKNEKPTDSEFESDFNYDYDSDDSFNANHSTSESNTNGPSNALCNSNSSPHLLVSNTKNAKTQDDPAFNKRDYRRKNPQVIDYKKIPYPLARRQLKLAVLEFYHFTDLVKNYRSLNRVAFRKMIKKFDKLTNSKLLPIYMNKVNNCYFSSSDVLDNLIPKIEDMYSNNFENGNRKLAIEKLRRKEIPQTYYFSVFSSGMFLGIALPILIISIVLGAMKISNNELPEGATLFQIWGGFLIPCIMYLSFGVNCLVWNYYKINYQFIFEFNTFNCLDYKQFFLLPSLFLFVGSLITYLSFSNFDYPNSILPGRYLPWFFVGFVLCVFLMPFKIFYYHSRRWFQIAIWRLLLSGFYPVEFRDFFLGDIFCSLTYALSNIAFTICIYSTKFEGILDGCQSCSPCSSSKSRIMGFLQTLPGLWRFLQCYRRYADTGDKFPHLANMLKYFVATIYYMTLSIYRIDRSPTNRTIFIFFAIINSTYSGIWDIFMDWSLGQYGSKNFLLRDSLAFKNPWIYYFAIVEDIILRFQWVFYAFFTEAIRFSPITSFFVAFAEVIRRFIWIFFRMENEHCTNVALLKASREIPLPYSVIRRVTIRKPKSALINPNKINVIMEENETEVTQPVPPQNFTGGAPSIAGSLASKARIIRTLSRVITNAHAKDFQRRVPSDQVPAGAENTDVYDDEDQLSYNSEIEEDEISDNELPPESRAQVARENANEIHKIQTRNDNQN